MTKQEWDEAEKALKDFFHQVHFCIDGYKVTVRLVRVSTYKNAIAIYVDGVFRGEWLINECEYRRRFLPKKEKHLFTAKQMEDLRKQLRLSKKACERYNSTFTYYDAHWASFAAMKRHLIANNDNIELVKII